MIIEINYESKYSLGTTKNGEYLLHSMKSLEENEDKTIKEEIFANNEYMMSYFNNLKVIEKIYPNFLYNDITKDTVLGILSRLIGDIRRLNDIKKDSNHPIIQLQNKVHFEVVKEYFQNELITLHTIPKESREGAGGIIKNETSLINNNSFSELLMCVFNYKTPQEIMTLIKRLNQKDKTLLGEKYNKKIDLNMLVKEMKLSDKVLKKNPQFHQNLQNIFGKKIINIHGILLYKMLEIIKNNNLFTVEIENLLTAKGNISGIAPGSGGLTTKDFIGFHVGSKKENWILPYFVNIKYQHTKKQTGSKINSNAKIGVTKEGGKLIIQLDIEKDEAIKINQMIEDAKVNTFYLGKKGLAFVSQIKGVFND